MKLAPSTLRRIDSFTLSNFGTLNANDWDLGSAGPTLLPGTNLLATGGKEGKGYLLSTGNLGRMVAGDTQIPQSFTAVDPTATPTATHHVHNTFATWASPTGLNLYVSGENDYLRAFRLQYVDAEVEHAGPNRQHRAPSARHARRHVDRVRQWIDRRVGHRLGDDAAHGRRQSSGRAGRAARLQRRESEPALGEHARGGRDPQLRQVQPAHGG